MAIDARARWPLALGATAVLLGACARGSGPGMETAPPAAMADLGGLIVFANPAECEPGEPLRQLYDTMAVYDDHHQPQPSQPVVPPRYAGAVGPAEVLARESDHAVFSVPVRGRWQGLPVRAVEGIYGIESDAFGMAIVFDAPVPATLPVLEAQGFRPAAAGSMGAGSMGAGPDAAAPAADLPPEQMPFGRAEVTGDARTSRLVCDWGL